MSRRKSKADDDLSYLLQPGCETRHAYHPYEYLRDGTAISFRRKCKKCPISMVVTFTAAQFRAELAEHDAYNSRLGMTRPWSPRSIREYRFEMRYCPPSEKWLPVKDERWP